MPTVTITRDVLFEKLGQKYSEEEFEDECFDFGIELDDVVEEEEVTKYKIDIPANRYDLLCVEGLALGLNVFRERCMPPRYIAQPPKEVMIVDKSVDAVRPHCVAAVLRNFTFTEEVYNSFILLQDKLHQNIGRERSLVSIGTHDLDTISGPFKYQALDPQDIKFHALKETEVMTAPEMFEKFRQTYLKPYLQIIEDKPQYPVITDSNNVVLSMPPIINGEHSKITLQTKNILIEVTANDKTKANIVLDTICCMFSEYCEPKYNIESVSVKCADETIVTPRLKYRTETCSAVSMCAKSGITDLTPAGVASMLTKMCLSSKSRGDEVLVQVGPTRHDVIHQCDLEEDIAIAYGYNNIIKRAPALYTIGNEQEVNKLSDGVREELARAGFTEVLTFSLCSKDDISVSLRTPKDLEQAVTIANPKTNEFQVVRTQLLPGILKTASCNRKMPLPLKLFEVSDVVVKDEDTETGCRNKRNVCVLFCGKTSGYEVVHGVLDRLMLSLAVPSSDYCIKLSNNPMFFEGRGADVLISGDKVGHMGILHPEVLEKFDITLPCSILELDLGPLV